MQTHNHKNSNLSPAAVADEAEAECDAGNCCSNACRSERKQAAAYHNCCVSLFEVLVEHELGAQQLQDIVVEHFHIHLHRLGLKAKKLCYGKKKCSKYYQEKNQTYHFCNTRRRIRNYNPNPKKINNKKALYDQKEIQTNFKKTIKQLLTLPRKYR